MTIHQLLPLVGVLIVVVGFLVRLNPLLVVALAALVTGLVTGESVRAVIEAIGRSFTENRYVAIVWIVLPVIGLLERYGLQERAQRLIAQVKMATSGRILLIYLVARQITAALGLTSLGGQAQMVRPLLSPMTEGAWEARFGTPSTATRMRLRAHAAAVDNIGVFFGEDIFVAIGSILLIRAFLAENGINVEPTRLSVWAIPTAVLALAIHGTRLALLDRRLRRSEAAAMRETAAGTPSTPNEAAPEVPRA